MPKITPHGSLLLCDLGPGPSPASVSPSVFFGVMFLLLACCLIQLWGVEGQL